MKKFLKTVYILVVLGILGALLYKEGEFIKELVVLKKEKAERKEAVAQSIDENYKPRKENFYQDKK